MEVRVYDLIQIGAEPPGIDPYRLGCGIRDNRPRYEASLPNGPEFSHWSAVSAHDHRTSGFYLPENPARFIAQLTLSNGAPYHDSHRSTCSTSS
jgi:hypothetical protein